MLKLDFGKYIYFNATDSIENNNNKKFDKKHRDSLIAQGKYKEAVTYLKNYNPTDPKKAYRYKLDIANLERTAKIYEAKVQRLGKDKDLVQFVDLLYQGNLSNYVKGNSYINNYNKKIKSLGSDSNNNVSITFKPKKQYAFGAKWLDWLAADNEEYNIDVFYKNSGLSRAQLESAGVKFIDEEDGSTTIKVNKGHELFNKIITGVPMDSHIEFLAGGGFINSSLDSNIPIINSTDIRSAGPVTNVGIVEGPRDALIIYELQQIVKDAQEKRDNIFKKYEPDNVQKSGYVTKLVTPELLQLEQAVISGAATKTQYDEYKNKLFGEINTELITSPFENYNKVYTNRFNETGDETLRELSATDYASIKNKLITNLDNLEYSVYNNGVEEGLLITYKGISAPTSTKLGIYDNDDLTDDTVDKPFSVFIPGMASNFINSTIGLDPNYRANKELLDMANYGITHELDDGTTLRADNNGRIFATKNGTYKELDRSEALTLINKEYVINDAKNQFLYDSVNKDNDIIDVESYDLKAKKQAISYATEMYPEVNIFYDVNTSEYNNIEDYIFSKQQNGVIQENVANNMPYDVYNVYKELFDVYRKIMNGLKEHINIYGNDN